MVMARVHWSSAGHVPLLITDPALPAHLPFHTAVSASQNALALCRPTTTTFLGPPFVPVAAYPLDLFPDTPHCEVVMVLERAAATPTLDGNEPALERSAPGLSSGTSLEAGGAVPSLEPRGERESDVHVEGDGGGAVPIAKRPRLEEAA